MQQLEGTKVLLGDNLASHFTAKVIRAVQQNDVYFCALPPNATHLMQPLGCLCVRADEASVAEHPDGVAHRDEEEGVLPEGDLPHSHA